MTTTIENKLCNEDIHEVVKVVPLKEAGQSEFMMGNCYYCNGKAVIDHRYRNVNGQVYELKNTSTKINVLECRE